MKLLLDGNISWRIVKYLTPVFGDVLQIHQTDLVVNIKDSTIWQVAKEGGFTIITKDEDFWHLLAMKGFPPKVILLRNTNFSNQLTAERILQNQKRINDFLNDPSTGLLEI